MLITQDFGEIFSCLMSLNHGLNYLYIGVRTDLIFFSVLLQNATFITFEIILKSAHDTCSDSMFFSYHKFQENVKWNIRLEISE